MNTFLAAAGIGLANFGFIGLKAFQQRNVIHNNFGWVLITSNGLAVFEVFIIASVAREGFTWVLAFALGIGGGLGCIAAMKLHNRFVLGRG
jgi:hypothetical protein